MYFLLLFFANFHVLLSRESELYDRLMETDWDSSKDSTNRHRVLKGIDITKVNIEDLLKSLADAPTAVPTAGRSPMPTAVPTAQSFAPISTSDTTMPTEVKTQGWAAKSVVSNMLSFFETATRFHTPKHTEGDNSIDASVNKSVINGSLPRCIQTTRDVDKVITGHWEIHEDTNIDSVFSQAETTSSWLETACPAELITASCYHRGLKSLASMAQNRRFVSPDCEIGVFNALDFMALVKDRKVVFGFDGIGDSLWQFMTTFIHEANENPLP